jgi:transcriptional regulator
MFIPSHFKNANIDEVKDFIRQNGFGILVSHTGEKLWGTHIPFELSGDSTFLEGHLSKGNQQWKNFKTNDEVMVIFTGPHTYVSSSWYDHENVPTWNYIAVHVYGRIKLIEGDELYASLKNLIDRYEAHSSHPVSMETMSEEYVRKSISGLVGFKIEITSIEGAYKLSQNRNEKNFRNIISELEKRADPDSHAVAKEMTKRIPTSN